MAQCLSAYSVCKLIIIYVKLCIKTENCYMTIDPISSVAQIRLKLKYKLRTLVIFSSNHMR